MYQQQQQTILKHKTMAHIFDSIEIGNLTLDVNFYGDVTSTHDISDHDGHQMIETYHSVELTTEISDVWKQDDVFKETVDEIKITQAHEDLLKKYVLENYVTIEEDLINSELY